MASSFVNHAFVLLVSRGDPGRGFLEKNENKKNASQVLLRPGGALEENGGVDDGVVPAGRAQDGDRVQAADGPKDAGHHLQGAAEEGEASQGVG